MLVIHPIVRPRYWFGPVPGTQRVGWDKMLNLIRKCKAENLLPEEIQKNSKNKRNTVTGWNRPPTRKTIKVFHVRIQLSCAYPTGANCYFTFLTKCKRPKTVRALSISPDINKYGQRIKFFLCH